MLLMYFPRASCYHMHSRDIALLIYSRHGGSWVRAYLYGKREAVPFEAATSLSLISKGVHR